MSDTIYFANEDVKDITARLYQKIEENENYNLKHGMLSLWRNSMSSYTRNGDLHGQIIRGGAHGEISKICINHYRNLISHIVALTTQNKTSYEPIATNTDYKSQSQTILARSLLDYYLNEMKLDRLTKLAVQNAIIYGEGFIKVEWNASAGELYDYDEESDTSTYDGDMDYKVFAPFDVFRDISNNDNNNRDWYIVRTYENKYDLAAKYPEIAEDILGISDTTKVSYSMREYTNEKSSSIIPVYELLHKKTPAVEDGRRTTFLTGGIVLEDGGLPYRNLPLYRIAQEDYLEKPYGYSVAFDLLPIQTALDGLYSTVVTNQKAFGVQNILIPKGNNLTVQQLTGGMNILEYDSQLGAPQSLNLTNTPKEIFDFIIQLEHQAETISGINSVARGNPEASLRSGSALALVQSQAISFNAVLQQSYISLLQDVGTATINILRDFAKSPRIAAIAGKSNRTMIKEFTGDDLDLVNRVTVDVGNPLASTTAGRVQLAENLIQNGMIKDPQLYIQVLTTGKLDPVIEGEQAELLNIRSENEELSNGNSVPVLATDSHKQHILEHKALLASPEARRDPVLINSIAEHIQAHLAELSNPENIGLFMLLGQEPLQDGMPQEMPQEGGEQLEGMPQEGMELDNGAGQVDMPSMPTDPLTGEQFQPQEGF